MNIEVITPRHQWSPASLAPEEPPVLDEEEVADVEENELTAEEEARKFRTHGLEQYCEYSRRLVCHAGIHPAYIGYSVMPEDLRGVCDH